MHDANEIFKDWPVGMHPESRPFFIMKSCKNCNTEFEPKTKRQVFCSPGCTQKHGGRAYYHRNREKRLQAKKEWAEQNKEHVASYMKEFFLEKSKINKKSKPTKPKKVKPKKVKPKKVKPKKVKPKKVKPKKVKIKKVREKVKTKCIKTYNREYHRNRRKTDKLFALASVLRSRLYAAFKTFGYKKNSTTEKILGADWETVCNHLEGLFTEGMTWDNRGEWEVDHIMPLSSAKSEKEMELLCNYKNLQPLWRSDNRKKGAKIVI